MFAVIGMLCVSTANAEIVTSSASYYSLRHEAESSQSAEQLWNRLVRPRLWWDSDHTYSGDAENMSLDLRAGGLWREDWEGGSVLHGLVRHVEQGKMLRLDAPFGPLAEIGASVVWTITIEPRDVGSNIIFHEVAFAPDYTDMNEVAMAVDFVKSGAIARLVATP